MKLDNQILKVYKAARGQIVIYLKSDWFTEDYYSVIEKEEYFIIKKHYIEIPEEAKKYTVSHQLTLKSKLKPGAYTISVDDSDEDELYIYHSTRT